VQFRGNGFLRKMVRHLVGAMIAAGQHKIDLEYIKRLLKGMPEDLKHGRARGWDAADARGLMKIDVEYSDEIKLLFEQPATAAVQTSDSEESVECFQ
jgi:tRNA U38,U39,U40 pseudouridine synthase TruA